MEVSSTLHRVTSLLTQWKPRWVLYNTTAGFLAILFYFLHFSGYLRMDCTFEDSDGEVCLPTKPYTSEYFSRKEGHRDLFATQQARIAFGLLSFAFLVDLWFRLLALGAVIVPGRKERLTKACVTLLYVAYLCLIFPFTLERLVEEPSSLWEGLLLVGWATD